MTISVSKQFTDTPGGRKRQDGMFSGEEFRESFLEAEFAPGKQEIIEVDLDGCEGFATAFLEEVFGGLARQFGSEAVGKRIKIISTDEPLLVDEVERYIRNANRKA